MKTEIQEQIESLGERLLELLPPHFRTAWLYCEVDEGAYSADLFFVMPDDTVHYKTAARALGDTLYRLWTLCRDFGPEPWCTMTMTVREARTFEIDYTYDEISGTSDPSERRHTWLEKYVRHTNVVYPPRE